MSDEMVLQILLQPSQNQLLLIFGDFYKKVDNIEQKPLAKLRNLGQLCQKSAVDWRMFTLDIIVNRLCHSKFSNFFLKLPKVIITAKYTNIVTKFARTFEMTICGTQLISISFSLRHDETDNVIDHSKSLGYFLLPSSPHFQKYQGIFQSFLGLLA